MIQVYLNGNEKRKLEFSSLCGMTLINCLSQGTNVAGPVHKKELKTAVIDNDRPKRLSAAVAKINMELWNTDSDNEKDTDSSHILSDFYNESYSSDPDIY